MTEPSSRRATHLPLDGPGVVREKFGSKAQVLSRLAPELRVPRGYAIDLEAVNAEREDLLEILGCIRSTLTDAELVHHLDHDGQPLMVRSSAIVEDTAPALFPGRFLSLRNRHTVGELKEGIEECIHHAATSKRVAEYRSAHELGDSPPLTSVLVQVQVPADYAGVMFTRAPRPYQRFEVLIEVTDGPAGDLLGGHSLGALYGVEPESRFEQLSGPLYPLDDLTPLLHELMRYARDAERLLGEPQDIEWVWSANQLYVVQARPAQRLLPSLERTATDARYPANGRRRRELPLPLIKHDGQKAAAARYFKRLGFGAPNVQILQSDLGDDRVAAELAGRRIAGHGTVVRFSSIGEATAGLPVRFVAPDEDLPSTYVRLRKQADKATKGRRRCTGIVSDYMYVEHAFEAFVDAEAVIVEHVPGNWEPQNDLQPDVLLFEGDAVQAWCVRNRRKARFELPSAAGHPATLLRKMDPIANEDIATWLQELPAYFAEFRKRFRAHLPLNFHFVRAGDHWHFLNIRPTRDLPVARTARTPQSKFKRQRLFLVPSTTALRSWDGESPVLVTVTPDLPDLERLATLSAALRGHGVTRVFTTFGVLSHPALVMREFGLEVQPMYDLYEAVDPRTLES